MTPEEQRKVRLLERIEHHLAEAIKVLDEDEFSDDDMDEIYGAITTTMETIWDIVAIAETPASQRVTVPVEELEIPEE